ncbi:MAG: NifU family protein [Azospirillum sp.]|nr:NifU family protein [Azospirillum sp.]
MFIQTEQTPNPSTLKFLPGREVTGRSVVDFTDPANAGRSPLAKRLFEVDGVTGVFLGSDFISVSKAGDREWFAIKPSILGAIMEHFNSGQPVLTEAVADDHDDTGDDGEIVKQIKELLDTRVRPAVAQDGGDITFHGFESGIVYLHMKGACSGCPSSTATLRAGIENMLRYYIPEIVEVRAVR